MNLPLFIARRIKDNGKKAISSFSNRISVFSVAISFAVMLVALSVSSGFRNEINNTVSGFTGDIFLVPPGVELFDNARPVEKHLSYLGKLSGKDYVENVSPFIYTYGIIKSSEGMDALLFKGMDSSFSRTFFESRMAEGVLPEFKGKASNSIVISKRMAEKNRLETGDKVTAYFINDGTKARRLEIAGIYDARFEELDEKLILCDIRMLQRVLGWSEDYVNGYEIHTNSDPLSKKTEYDIQEMLYNASDDDHSLIPGYASDLFPNIYDWLVLVDMNFVLILALMIIVCGFNMISGLLIILFERISMIGTLKALGMTNGKIRKIFIYKASMIVVKGMAIGNAAALAVSALIAGFKVLPLDPENYFISYVPAVIDPAAWIATDIAAFAAILLILLVPSTFISKISPEKTMRVK